MHFGCKYRYSGQGLNDETDRGQKMYVDANHLDTCTVLSRNSRSVQVVS